MPTTQIGSHTAYYDESGSGHPLLFITGLGGTRMGWWKQLEPFSARYHVVNMDNRDAGDSAVATAPYTIADMAEDAAGVLQHLNLGKTHVVGISMGGMIAQELALRHPDLVDKLVLTSTTAGGQSHVNPSPEIAAILMRMDDEDLAARVRNTYTAIAGPGYMAAHPADLEHIIASATAKPMTVPSYQRQLGACLMHATDTRLGQLTAPTLVVHGDADPLVPYPNGQYLAAHINGARLSTYIQVGHLPPIEAADRYNRELFEFLC